MLTIKISGSAIVKDNKLLLLYKTKARHYELPGGKIESTETKEQTAIREAKEEIGIDIKLTKYYSCEEFILDANQITSHIFLATYHHNQTPKNLEPQVFDHIKWIPLDNYQSYPLAPNVKSFCQKFPKLFNQSVVQDRNWHYFFIDAL